MFEWPTRRATPPRQAGQHDRESVAWGAVGHRGLKPRAVSDPDSRLSDS
jgi:hypothetical protein